MVSSINGVFCAVLFSSVILGSKCEVNAKPGEDIVLQCQAPRGAAIGLIQWTRPDLKSGDVFFYRDGNSHNNYQHASFRGRVKLRDPQMKDGDVSVILQNVTINDAGRYDCRIIINSGSTEPATPQLMNNIHLMVTESELNTIKVKPGQNVLLQCHDPKHAIITLLQWIRPDLDSEGYVFFYRDRHLYDNYQHPSFVNRVELRDPGMKDGDGSVILMNVTNNDTGTYKCYVFVSKPSRHKRASPDFSKTIKLVVEDSGHTTGLTGDGGHMLGHAALSLSFIGVICAAFGIF